MIAGAPIPIDSRVSRTCLPIEVLGDAAYTLNANHLSSVKVRIYPRAQVPGDSCSPECDPLPHRRYGCGCGDTPPPTPVPAGVLEYPGHCVVDERVCFHWDNKLWGLKPGRYVAVVLLCDAVVDCFQIQVGRHVALGQPTNVPFNPCDVPPDPCSTEPALGCQPELLPTVIEE